MTQRIGRFRLDGVIGVGTFATVHRAYDERLDDVVAVKILAENHSLNPDVRGRFIAEGRSLRRVRDPHVVGVYDIGENERQQPFLVLEHADRGTLARRVADLRARGWLPGPQDVLAVATSLAAAVDAVHRARLVHRDLSPGNVLLRSVDAPGDGTSSAVVRADERLVVADLGMCKDMAINSGLTVAGGTDGFRPPEQRGGPGTIDVRADLWALSALLVWLCTGQRADEIDVAEAFERLAQPARLGEALRISLASEPGARHAGVAAWIADVGSATTESPTVRSASPSAGAHSATADDTAVRTSWRRRVRMSVTLAAVALVVGVGVGLLVGSLMATDEGTGDVEDLGDGRVRVVDADGDANVGITGPPQVAVGDDARFEADTAGVAGWVWTMPDGDHIIDAEQVRVQASSTGVADVTLRARTTDGADLEVTLELRVSER